MKNSKRTLIRTLVTGAFLSCGLMSSALMAGDLLVYSTTDADNLKWYMEEFQKAHPDINVKVIRDSTGIMHARLMAEKNNPRADVLFEMAATSALTMEKEGMLEPYKPAGMDKIDQRYVDKNEPVTWVGNYGWAGCICWNRVEAKKLGLPKPSTWAELANPIYKGHISMPNPASSGTGFLDVSSWIQIMGEEKAWSYMDALHKNIAVYTHSGSKPCKQAASGEFAIGVSWPFRAVKLIKKGAPIDIIVPEEGIGWEMQVVAIIKGTKNLTDAKRLVDWSIGEHAQGLFGQRQSVVAMTDKLQKDKLYPDRVQEKMIDNKFAWASQNKARIIAEWRKRYDVKSEPKKKKK